jgi:threonyl-tRNA synthetase
LERLKRAGLRASLDRSGERLGKLIRNGEQMKIPVLAVIGAKEAEQSSVSLRSRRQGDLGTVPLDALIEAACRANGERAASLLFPEESPV